MGICGVMNQEIEQYVFDYKQKYGLTDDNFIDEIQRRVEYGG
jgi:hypothetical protein